MSSEKIEIALYGPTLLTNFLLRKKLEKEFETTCCTTNHNLWYTLSNQQIHVILMEISEVGSELNFLSKIHIRFPNTYVISLGKERPKEYIIKAFQYGSIDFFKMPFPDDLLIDRIKGIIASQKFLKAEKN